MQELSYHILDLVQNALTAGASRVSIRIREDRAEGLLTIDVEDNGRGMNEETARQAADPFVTSRKESGIGLGLALLKAAAESCGGGLTILSQEGRGTCVRALFQLHHVNRAPLGDMGETLETLISGHPEVHFRYDHRVDRDAYTLDTEEMKAVLGREGFPSPEVREFIRRDVHEGLKKIGAARVPEIIFPIRES